jgi:DNA-binding NtrC family response regulator
MLLRVLESGEFRPLGSTRWVLSQARLIAATDRDLGGDSFNQALLWRLEGFVLRMPALRERREDLGLLMVHLPRRWEAETGRAPRLPAALVSEMCRYDWPGNVRQLANVVRRAVIGALAGEPPVLADLVPAPKADAAPVLAPAPQAGVPTPRTRLSDLTAEAVLEAMELGRWSVSADRGIAGVAPVHVQAAGGPPGDPTGARYRGARAAHGTGAARQRHRALR